MKTIYVVKSGNYSDYGIDGLLIHVWAKNKKQAIKIANKLRAIFITDKIT